MAEIHVQPKKHTSNNAWLWILLLLIVAGVVYYLVVRNRTADTNTTRPTNTSSKIHPPSPTRVVVVETRYI